VQGLLTANADAQFNGNVTVGTAQQARQLRVHGTLLFDTLEGDNLLVRNTLTVGGASQFNGDVTVGTAQQARRLTVTGDTTVGGTAQFNGNVAIGTAQQARQLTVTGTASVSGNTAVGGTLTVSGATNLNNTLAVAGATSLDNTLTVQGLLTANADAQFNGNVTVGTAEAPRQVRVNGNLVAPGAGINTPTFVFIHQYTGEEASPQTELNHPLLNGNPTAIILVTYNATGSGSLIPLNSSVGVRYDPGTERWYIYTLSGGNDIQPNATFNVMIVTTN